MYKNKANERRVLRDEEDWLVANGKCKWKMQMERMVRSDKERYKFVRIRDKKILPTK